MNRIAKDATLYVLVDGEVRGPFSLDELIAGVRMGRYSKELLVAWQGVDGNWIALKDYAPSLVELASSGRATGAKLAVAILSVSLMILTGLSVHLWLRASSLEKQQSANSDQVSEVIGEQLQQNAGTTETDAKSHEMEELTRSHREFEHQVNEERKRLTTREAELVALEKSARAQLELAKTGAREFAKRFVNVLTFVQDSSVLPEKIFVSIDMGKGGLLDFDEELIRATIENQLKNSGFVVIEKRERSDEALVVIASVGQLTSQEGVQASYMLDFHCFGRAFIGYQEQLHSLYENSSFGYAGTRSNFNTSAKEFFEAETIKCIAAVNKIRSKTESVDIQGIVAEKLRDYGIEDGGGLPPVSNAKPVGTGSGFVISSRPLILTNAHVIKNGDRIRIHFKSKGKIKDAVVLHQNKIDDLAVLALKEQFGEFDALTFPSLAEDSEAKIGAEVFSLGYPMIDLLGGGVKFSSGTISSTVSPNDSLNKFQLSVPTQPGNSGGPVYFKNGKFCGLIASTLNPFKVAADHSAIPQNVNYAIGMSAIRSFLGETSLLSEVLRDRRGLVTVDEAKDFAVLVEVLKE